MNLFEQHTWQPFQAMGFTHSFWHLNKETLIFTWIAMAIFVVLALIGRRLIDHPYTISGYLAESYTRTFINLVTQTLGRFEYKYCAFFGILFTYIFLCNALIIFPFLEEPTKDINTTLALALISFVYVQREAISAHGILGYLKEFFKPFVIFFPLEVLGKVATVVSLSFRLFGNIFGGSIISAMWANAISGSIIMQLSGIFLGINLLITLFFGLFEGAIQAFVFTILSLTYLSMATLQEEHE